ncbi:MAG TPA: DUF92 domain-containing protein [Methanomassiliicoccales archaeon]|nr:DUF92 domain-containing protein [Methanomassiliicoccales archaeon]
MSFLETVLLVLVLCGALSALSYRFKLLTASGSIASFGVGTIIGLFGSVNWLVALIVFVFMGFAVTRYRFRVKERGGLQEGRKGERTYRNVLANGLVPAVIAVVAWASSVQLGTQAGIVYISAVSVAASDTVASELGVLSKRTRLITTMKPVPAGTDGGVSLYGTAWAFVGALVASLVGWLVILPDRALQAWILVPVLVGFLGCNVDSVIGATLERNGIVDKLGTNILSMAIGTLLAAVIVVLVPVV